MKILINSLLVVIAAAIGLGVGFLLRGKPGHQEFVANPESQTIPQRLGTLRRQAVPLIDNSPLTTKLARDLSMSSGVTRWLYWLEALDKAQPADFPRLVRLAQTNDTALRFVMARWVEIAPRHLFDTLMENHKNSRDVLDDQLFSTLANSLFTEWPKRDPDAAIAALNESGEIGMARHWRFEVAYGMVDKDIERSLRLISEWGCDIGFGTSGLRAVAKWAQTDPRHAAEFLMAHPLTSHVGRGIIEEIGNVWGKTDPAAALDFVGNRSDTLARTLAEAALKQWSERDLNEAANWLASADPLTRNRMSAAFVEVWGKQDPTSALSWCEENLSGLSLNSAVAGVVKGTAQKDLAAAAALVASMEPSSARAEAAAAISRKMFPDLLSGKPVTQEALAWLGQLDPGSMRRVTDEISWSWAGSDAKSMAAFLSAADPDAISPYAYNIVGRELARKGPSAALQWASQLPAEKALVAGGEVFAEWRSFQPEAAMKWLNRLPKNDSRREPFFKQAIQNLAHHPQAAEQLAAMAATERAAALPILEAMNLPIDRRTRLLEAANAK